VVFQARSGTSEAELNAALQQPGGNIAASIAGEHRIAWRVRGGYEFGNGLALEAGYTDLGDVRTVITGTVVDIEELLATANAAHPHSARGVEASLAGRYALNEIASLHARVGTDVLYGIGAEVAVYKEWSVDVDWACYQVARERIKTFGAGVTWRFR
jgi:opacity protein-like surface antigen